MPARIYSTTFMRAASVGATYTYTVPAGFRAVIKSIDAVGFSPGGGFFYVTVNGVYIAYQQIQAAYSTFHSAPMVVAYAGQQIACLVTGQLIHCTISGYLFVESALSRGRIPEVEVEEVATPAPLPA